LIRTFQVDQDIATMPPQLTGIRLQLDRPVERLESLLEPPLALPRDAEGEKVLRLGILLDGARNPLCGMIVLIKVERQQAHQMQGIGVVGIGLERALTAKFGVEIPLGSQISETGFVKRGAARGCGARGAARRCPGLILGRSPAFTTIHVGAFQW
jgi:hypothetical protein